MDNSLAQRYTELTREKRALDKRTKEITEELGDMQEQLLEQMASDGIDRVTLNGMNLTPKRELWAATQEGNYDGACDALVATGFGDLVQRRFNSNQLSALVREMDDAGTPIPPEWDGVIKVSEVFKISATEAKRG